MLFKQSIINDANILNRSSRYASLLEDREPIGFRVELERSEVHIEETTVVILDTIRYSKTD
jgi:hypothetical protein